MRMYSTEFKFLSTQIISDEIGVQKEQVIESDPIPIIKIEDIYADEFYKANERGFKPSLRLRINSLNYNYEEELKYMDTIYSIIRTQQKGDELILICERKIKNAKL